MRRLLTALAFCLFATGAWAQGCGNNNPNCIVPTAPLGTSDNRAASTAFVAQAVPFTRTLSAAFYPPFELFTANVQRAGDLTVFDFDNYGPNAWGNVSNLRIVNHAGAQGIVSYSQTADLGYHITATLPSSSTTIQFANLLGVQNSCASAATCYAYDLTTGANIPANSTISSLNNGASTITLNNSTTVAQGDVIWVLPIGLIQSTGYYSVAANNINPSSGTPNDTAQGGYLECRSFNLNTSINGCAGLEVDPQAIGANAKTGVDPNHVFGQGSGGWVVGIHIVPNGSSSPFGAFSASSALQIDGGCAYPPTGCPSSGIAGAFNKGIVFNATAITASSSHYEAMNLFSGNVSGTGQVAQEIDWYDDAGNETRFAPAQNNIQTTSTDGTVLANWTAAVSAHKQQYSPRIHWYGSGWDFSPAAARTFDFTMESRPNAPTAGTAATAALTISEGENGGTISRIAGFYSTTTGTDGGGLFYSSIVSGGYLNTASLLLTSNNCTGAGNLGSSSTSSFCGSSGGGGGGSSDTIQLATGSGVRMTILSNGNVGLGKETNPQGSFVLSANTNTGLTKATDLADFIAADGATAAVGFLAATNTTGNGTTLNGAFVFRTANGTVASPTALGTGSTIGNLGFGPYNGTNFTQTAKIQSFTGPSFNGTTDKGSYIEIDATANSGTTLAAAARFQAGVIIGVGTVDPGAGNLVMGTASTGPLATVNYANLTLNQTTGGNIAFQAASITQWQVFNTSTQFVIEDVVDTQNMMTFTAGAVGAGFITFPNTLDATNSTTASHVLSGGLAVAKKIITGSSASINTSSTTGTALNTSGTVFMASLTSVAVNEQDYICLTSANQIVADTTTCLASSARFKNILGPMEDGALQKIDRIEVNRWRYKPEGDFTTERWTRERIGPTAENIAAIDPRLVEFDPQGEPLKVSPDQLLALTIKAVQELKAANDNLEAEVQLLRRAR